MNAHKLPFLLNILPLFCMSLPSSNTIITVDFLQVFADVFNAYDADKIMLMMTSDCIFQVFASLDVQL
jgi:hypothetical protein